MLMTRVHTATTAQTLAGDNANTQGPVIMSGLGVWGFQYYYYLLLPL